MKRKNAGKTEAEDIHYEGNRKGLRLMAKKEFKVWCNWMMAGEYLIKAETLGEALELAEDDPGLPDINTCYVDGSFEVNSEVTMEINGRDTQ